MIIAIGRIENKNSLIGIRIYDTNNKSIKDIKIEDSDKIDIKNRSKIYRLGVIDNKKESKPLVLLGYKDRKYKVLNINGEIKILEDTNGYEIVNIKSNIEEYKDYITKLRLIGKEEVFRYEIKEETDEVIITNYIPNKSKYRVIEIPSFVTGIKKDEGEDFEGIFKQLNQSLKVIHRHNQIKDMSWLFSGFRGKNIDIRDFNTSNVTDMNNMFYDCRTLKELDVRNFDTSNVTDMRWMFSLCDNIEKLDISNFNTDNVINMRGMFYECNSLKKLDLSNFNTSKVTDMSVMFAYCNMLKELNIKSFNTSNVKNANYLFEGTLLTEKNTGLDLNNNIIFKITK